MSKTGMDTYCYESEIREQPEMLRQNHSNWSAQAAECTEQLSDRKRLVVLGRGSSGNACTFASYLWGMQTGLQAIEFRPWLATLPYESSPDWSDCKVFAYSVSGQSTDVAQAAAWLQQHGAKVLGITNDEHDMSETHIGRACSSLFRLDAGPEKAVPSSKTFTAQLFASAALCGYQIRKAAEQTADCFDEILNSERAKLLADFLSGARQVAWLARGPAMAAALDSALKMQETAGVASRGYSSAEFLHGPVGAYDKQDRAVIFLDGDAPYDNHDTVIATLLNKKIPVLVVAQQKGGQELRGSTLPVPFPENIWPRAALLILLAQQASLLLAVSRGLNPDAPAGLRKVTQT